MARRQRKQLLKTNRETSAEHTNSKGVRKKTVSNPSVNTIVQLQKSIGNRAVSEIINSGSLQAKLAIGQAGDRFEAEADAVAQRVVSMPKSVLQKQNDEKEKKLQAWPKESVSTANLRPVEEEKKELQKKQSEEKKEDKEIKRKSVLPEDEKKDEMKVMRQVSEKEEKKKELSESIRGKTEAVSKQQTTVASTIESAIGTLRGNGKPLTTDERSYFEPRMKEDFSDVRIHTDSHAGELAQAINAQAFTIKNDIVFGAGKYQPGNTTGRMLMAHELGHVVQQRGAVAAAERKSPSLIAQGSPEMAQLRAATFLERRAWLAFFDHYLPRKFLNNYMDDTGNPITLTRQEMIDCNAVVDIRRSGGFRTELAQLTAAGGGSAVIDVSGWAGAMTNGTLGNFTIYYHGTLTVNPNGTWTFNGTMTFYDYWDFNTGGANRPLPAEIKVRVANAFLPGQPFHIYSVPVQVSQSNADNQVQWNARTPRHVPDRAARTGADIEVGTETGGVDIGSEAGAQSAEDLNR